MRDRQYSKQFRSFAAEGATKTFSKLNDKNNIINKQIQRLYVPRQDFFKDLRNHLKNLKFIGGVTLTR